jgi:hypothetical protein
MNGNFDKEQNLKNGRMTVDARGWLEWEEDDDFADITITVIQDGYECAGPQFRCYPPSANRPVNDTWRVDVTRPEQPPWNKGRASGRADAVVTKKDGTKCPDPWNSPPLTLK